MHCVVEWLWDNSQ